LLHDGYGLGLPAAHATFPSQAKLRHILLVDLSQRAESLRVVRPAEHEPIAGTRILEHVLRHRSEALQLRECEGSDENEYEDKEDSAAHAVQYKPRNSISPQPSANADPTSELHVS
jgi:hypothetical protein